MNIESLDIEKFKKNLKLLRKRLNKIRETGIVDENFEEELEKLLNMEERLLKELIPYYRDSKTNRATNIIKVPINQIGKNTLDNFIKHIFKLDEKRYLISTIDGKLKLLILNNIDTELSIEWSLDFKNINELIVKIYIEDKDIILFGIRGGVYILDLELFELKSKLKLEALNNIYKIEDSIYLVDGVDDNYLIQYRNKNINRLNNIKIDNIRMVKKLEDNIFLFGMEDNEILKIGYEDLTFNIMDRFECNSIREIGILENEDRSKNIIILGQDGELKILSKDFNIEFEEKLEGNLFSIGSNNGTGTILSEDGIIYILEENFNNWKVNKRLILRDEYYTNIISLENSKYILIDLDRNLDLLKIDRIDNIDKLWDKSLYRWEELDEI